MGLTPEELEDLVQAIHETNEPGSSRVDMLQRFFDGTWSAICHRSGRAARFYLPDDQSPEARIYRLMTRALRE